MPGELPNGPMLDFLLHLHQREILPSDLSPHHRGDNGIESLGATMTTEKAIDGFEHNPYEVDARLRWGDEAVDGAATRIRGWTPRDAERARTGYRAVHQGLAELLAAGVTATDARVQQVIDDHYRVTALFWTPTRQTYLGLAHTYKDDDRFSRNIGDGNPALVTYLVDAMTCYAQTRLS